MGLFGGDRSSYTTTKKTYSTSSLAQEDKSVAAAGDAENILGSSAKQIQAQASTILDTPNVERDIIFNEFPEAVRSTVADLIENVEKTTKTLGQGMGLATETLGQALSEREIGGESEMAKIVMYLAIGGGLIFLTSKVLSKVLK